ncbi:MAG: ABC transporter ATP-binding protein [Acidimicrobiales bacterium]
MTSALTSPVRDGDVELRGLVVRYGDTISLKGVTHSIDHGEWLGLIGANGAGKTTLLRAVARLVEYEGDVTIGGHKSGALTRREFAQLVAYVPQKPEFPPEMRAVDYVALGRLPHLGYFGFEGASDRSHCYQLLERLGLMDLAQRSLSALSGGELQRLVLARALAQGAPVLLLDEPTSALDLGRRVEALELVDELRREHELTVISALHDLTLAGQFADRLMLLSHGSVVNVGTAEEVLQAASLDVHFGAHVRILRTDEGELVVVPQRSTSKGRHD